MAIAPILSPVALLDLKRFPYSFVEWLRQLGNYLDSGVYTPTLTNLVNVASTVASPLQFLRVGRMVTVSGELQLTPTVNSTLTALFLTLPVPTFFATAGQCAGVGVDQGSGIAGTIKNLASGSTAILVIPAGVVGASTFCIHFTYRVT